MRGTQARGTILGFVALAVILALYGWLIARNFVPAISEPDDNGYFAQGTLLAQTGHTWFKAQSDAQYIGMHWLVVPGQTYISRYPPGLAVIVAGVYKVFGYKASLLVNPALSVMALLAMFFVAGRLVSMPWALAATALLAFNPHFVHHALSGDSHMAVTCFLTWCLYFLVRWSQTPSLRVALLAGCFFGVIPTIRYPDAVMALGVGLFLLAALRRVPGIWKHYLVFIAGAAVPVLPLLVRNQLLLGAFWRTGYALTNEQTGFSWAYFREHALAYIQLLNSGGVGLLFALGIVGMVIMICLRPARPLGLMLTFICLPMLLLYMAYYWAPQMNSGMTMRFLLPTFPAYVLAGVWMLATFLKDAPASARVAVPVVLLTVQGLWGAGDLMEQMQRLHLQKETIARVTDKLDAVAKPGDVVIADNQILQNLDFVRKWKLADDSLVRGGGGGPGGPGMGGPGTGGGGMSGPGMGMGPDDNANAPSPMQREKRLEQREKYAGTFNQRDDKFAADLLHWADGHKVYLIGSETEVQDAMSPRSGDITIVARVQLPDPPPMEQRSRGGMGGPGGGGMGGGGGGGMGAPGMAGGPPGMGGPGMAGPGGQRGGQGGFGGPGMRAARGGTGGFAGGAPRFGGTRNGPNTPGGRAFASPNGAFGGAPSRTLPTEPHELVIAEWHPKPPDASASVK